VITIAEDNANGMTGSLRSLKGMADSSAHPYVAMLNSNLGNDCIALALPMYRLYEMSAVANERGLAERGAAGEMIAQRKLDPKHAAGLALYMLRGLISAVARDFQFRKIDEPAALVTLRRNLGPQPYFSTQPIVANIRTCGPGGEGLRFESTLVGTVKVFLSDRDVLWIIDGQHRRIAMDLLFTFLKLVTTNHTYPKRPALYLPPGDDLSVSPEELAVWNKVYEFARSQCSIVVDVHLGLDPTQEQQLFHDLNNLGKKVESSLAFQFDNSNAVNLFIKERLIDGHVLQCPVAEKDVSDWHDDQGAIGRKDLIAVNARLLLNKTTVAGAKPADIIEKTQTAVDFWEAVGAIPGFGEEGAKQKTVAAQPIVLKALAKLVYDFKFGKGADDGLYRRLLDGIGDIDFSHDNPMWRYYELSEEERKTKGLSGLRAFLPSDTEGFNRDIGAFDNVRRVMRFGAKHNDIFPILGDMVRWKLGLPNRHDRDE